MLKQWSREFQTALYAIDGIGSVRHGECLRALTEREISESEFWRNADSVGRAIGLEESIVQALAKFQKKYTPASYSELLKTKDIRTVFPQDEEFPKLLVEMENHPPLLFARGGKYAQQPSIAVVGTRSITDYGRRVIEALVPPLIHAGKTIVSGFMYGIDVAAQQAAVRAKGQTVGVLGFGFDHMYPPDQRELFEEFLSAGAVFFTPFAPHVPAKRGNFPARNAIVAGMSTGVLVVEAAAGSGSLITAGYAAELGREVWAVSGSIFSDFSEGTKELINQGAQLVTKPEDIIAGFSRGKYSIGPPPWLSFPDSQRRMCELLNQESLPLETAAERLGFTISEASKILIELELLGAVEQSGNKWRLAGGLIHSV
jgi:DNA processing protein